MTYYYINDKGLMQRQVGGDPPSAIFVAVAPDGIMRKFENGKLTASVPIPNNPLKDIIEQKNANTLLGVIPAIVQRKHKKRSKPKSKRKCRCKK